MIYGQRKHDRKMRVITLHNEKGGVGKTTLTLLIAMGLALRGWRVLLVDGDPQGHTSIRMGYGKLPGIYDLLVREANWKTVLKKIPPERYAIPGETIGNMTGKLYLLPGNKETMNISNMVGDFAVLTKRLDELDDLIDVVVIDTSPTASLLHGVYYTATDSIVYPTELTYTSFDGLVESLKARTAASNERQAKWNLPSIEVAGIVPMKYRKGLTEQDQNLATLREQFGDKVWHPMGLRTLWTESESRAVPVWNLDPKSDAAVDAWEMIDQVERHLKHVAA